MTTRSPIYTRIGPRQQPVELLTWTHTQVAIPPAPFIQRESDWPNPAPQKLNLQLRTWTNSLPPGVIGNPIPPSFTRRLLDLPIQRQVKWNLLSWIETPQPVAAAVIPLPAGAQAWPHTPQPQRQAFDVRTWIEVNQIPQPAAGAPFYQTDWQNPVQPRRPSDIWTWMQGVPPGTGPSLMPAAWDWTENPPARRNLELLTWIQSPAVPPPQTVVAPFFQSDWPNPQPQRQNHELRTWIASVVPLPTTVGAPFYQTDWPNPQPLKPNLELRTWVEGIPQTYLSLTIPSGKSVWPDAFPPIPNLELRTWTYQPAVLPGSVGAPFSQSDWPNPQQVRYPVQPEVPVNTLGSVLQPSLVYNPFFQTDWPNPLPQAQNLELRTWSYTYSWQAPAPAAPVAAPDTHDGYVANTQVLSESDWKRKRAELLGQKPKLVNRVVERADLKAESLRAAGAIIAQRDSAEDEDIILGAIADEEAQITSLLAEAAAYLVKHRLH